MCVTCKYRVMLEHPGILESVGILKPIPRGYQRPSVYISYTQDGFLHQYMCNYGASQVALVLKTLPANAEDIRDSGSIPGSGRSPRGGCGNPLQYS